ncbi:serine/threonine-protein kinase [Nonomuraea sp. NPDC049269]|uniref:serine/threonine-protein kinase n=1 Tax=Nonomuraea sp. NPDC049269 TaxID=3364349 RepID=UPI0037227CFC
MDAIGRYPVERVLGSGAFASVWLGRDDRLDSYVAIKVLADNWSAEPAVRERFVKEARLLRQADSPRIVQVYDIGELPDSRPYFVMTYADMGSLAGRVLDGPLPVPEALRILGEIAEGVAVLHRLGIVHRDLKPSNVLFRSLPGGGERLMVADLGVARSLADATSHTIAAGSPGYMAPEQMRLDGAPDERADVHGLGAMAYHLLTGQLPASGPVRLAPHRLRPEVPVRVGAAVMKAIDPDPDHRWQSIATFATALLPPADGLPEPNPERRLMAADIGPEATVHRSDRAGASMVAGDDASADAGEGDVAGAEVGADAGVGLGSQAGPGAGAGPDEGAEVDAGTDPGAGRGKGVVAGVGAVGLALALVVAVLTLRPVDQPTTALGSPSGSPGSSESAGPTGSAGPTATGRPTGKGGLRVGMGLRDDAGIPQKYRSLIIQAGTWCDDVEGLSPALVAGVLKMASDFDPDLSDPTADEYGIARWTPRVLQYWQPNGSDDPVPKPPFSPELSIPAMGRFFCGLGPQVATVPADPAAKLAALYVSGVVPVRRDQGVPAKWKTHVQQVLKYRDQYQS